MQPSHPRFPITLTIFSLCLCAGVPALAAPAAPADSSAAPRPVLAIDNVTQDGGRVEQGTVVPYRFTLQNRGQADLVIQRVKPSCGCSVVKWERLVKPGARSIIEAEMHTDHFRGPVSKQLTVLSNDPDHPQVELTISARVDPLIWVKPGPAAELSVGSRPVTQEFILERNGGRPMKVSDVVPSQPYVSAEAVPLPGAGRYQIKVMASPDAPLGRNIVAVTVHTDLDKQTALNLQVAVNKGIVTDPPLIFYGLLPPDLKAPVQATVTLMRLTSPFHIHSLKVDDRQLSPRLETVREGREYRVTVTYAGGWVTGLKRTMLTVTTDDPIQPTIQIPVQAVIQTRATLLPRAAAH